MQKTKINTAAAISVIATAVVMIGGLPTTMESASATHGDRHGFGGGSGVSQCGTGGNPDHHIGGREKCL